MTKVLAPKYNPKEVEDGHYSFWEERKYFHSEPDSSRKSFTIVIPPPNITGVLHMGHALNTIIQDVLIRWRRMEGNNTLWMPGTDHAGIATQNVVEKSLIQNGLKREEMGRKRFLDAVWQWRDEYGSTIIKQLKKLGSSCDWERERFTMDEGLSAAVREAFVRLWEKGLIYRGKYIINWCPRCQTALSDDEVDHETHDGHLWYIKYPFRDEPHLSMTVATTRPETMLGDVAVAVNPEDERYKEFVGETLVLPVVGREIPVIADAMVDKAFGTGSVKVTPAHDPNDFEISLNHGLEPVVVMEGDATMSKDAGEYAGMDRYECREALVEELRHRGSIAKIEPHTHSVGHCYRCRTVIEPRLSDQWFVKMKPLAETAIKATHEGLVTFHPARWTKVYLDWLENVRDWCISRQIWWGHQIPAWHCKDCEEVNVARTTPTTCSKCQGANLEQDPDVLDTWFSSALWPFSTLGWPEDTEELKNYYPTNVLVTDRGIIYFWVARMVMMGLEMLGSVPFHKVYIHGTILDELGRKMSKSMGNGIDPLDMTERYGVDAVRMSLLLLTTEGQDIKLSESKFEMGRNFTNKVWNATRFILMNLEGQTPPPLSATKDAALSFEDKWILSRLNLAIGTTTAELERFRFNDALRTIYEFFWHEFCDWYLEIIKPRLYEPVNEEDKAVARSVLVHVLQHTMKLLHPFAPFLTEEIWQTLRENFRENGLLEEGVIIASWPVAERRDRDIEKTMELLQEIVRSLRNIRRNLDIPDKQPLSAIISAHAKTAVQLLEQHSGFLKQMAIVEDLDIGHDLSKPRSSASAVVGSLQVFVPLSGVIDIDVEKQRQQKRITELDSYLEKVRKKLSNKNFVEKARADVVENERSRETELSEQISKLRQILTDLEK
ncbi:MAG: valine--tRNA ligase [Candidatus Brocadiales bacterium]